MEPLQLLAISFVLGVISHLLIKHPLWALVLPVAAVTTYNIYAMLSATYAGGGASMWPIAAFFMAITSFVGAGVGVFIVFILRKKK